MATIRRAIVMVDRTVWEPWAHEQVNHVLHYLDIGDLVTITDSMINDNRSLLYVQRVSDGYYNWIEKQELWIL